MNNIDTFTFGDIGLNPWTYTVELLSRKKQIKLSPREFRILSVLVRSYPDVRTRESILEAIDSPKVTLRTVDAHICGLRKKVPFAKIGVRPSLGYFFDGTVYNAGV